MRPVQELLSRTLTSYLRSTNKLRRKRKISRMRKGRDGGVKEEGEKELSSHNRFWSSANENRKRCSKNFTEIQEFSLFKIK
jgi:hypothetical protein